MKITMVMLMSLDGKTTRGNEADVRAWASAEDQAYFTSLIQQSRLIIMGRETYDAVKTHIRLSSDKLRVVLTRRPELYESKAVAGQLEFSTDTPTELMQKLEKRGFQELLLLGGSTTNAAFFQVELVDELYLTIEPTMFGSGKSLVHEQVSDISLQLISVKQLNERGTLLLIYKILHQ